MAKILKKTRKRLDGRINAWMASAKTRGGRQEGYTKPGSMKHK